MSRSAIPRGGNDVVMTPDLLALAIVRHFHPSGVLADPCQGEGAFYRAFREWSAEDPSGKVEGEVCFDLTEGHDFLTMTPDPEIAPGKTWDWIITNPPWGKMGDLRLKPPLPGFLSQAMRFAHDIVFLIHVNAFFTSARRAAMRASGYHIREIAECDRPREWRGMGLQLAAVHLSDTPGPCLFSRIDYPNTTPHHDLPSSPRPARRASQVHPPRHR